MNLNAQLLCVALIVDDRSILQIKNDLPNHTLTQRASLRPLIVPVARLIDSYALVARPSIARRPLVGSMLLRKNYLILMERVNRVLRPPHTTFAISSLYCLDAAHAECALFLRHIRCLTTVDRFEFSHLRQEFGSTSE